MKRITLYVFLAILSSIVFVVFTVGCPIAASPPSEDSNSGGGLPPDHYWELKGMKGDAGTDRPLPREHTAMAYGGGSKVVLFSGDHEDYSGEESETWIYDLEDDTWTEIVIAGTQGTDFPWDTTGHAMAYGGGDTVVLFGGWVEKDRTWEFDVGDESWTEYVSGGTSGIDKPKGRLWHGMAYGGGSKVVLFGGKQYNGGDYITLGDTWVYDTSSHTWTEYASGGTAGTDKPHPYDEVDLAFAGGSEVLLFGGLTDSGSQSRTWIFDAAIGTWTEYNTGDIEGVDKPSARIFTQLDYAGDSTVILFDGSVRTSETWEYDMDTHTWTEHTKGTIGTDRPIERFRHAMAYLGNNNVVVFGGRDSAWEWPDGVWVFTR